jgi:hypothetical protein
LLGFVSGHDFTGCVKTHVLYHGTSLQLTEKTPVFEGYELQLVRKCLQTGPALATEG